LVGQVAIDANGDLFVAEQAIDGSRGLIHMSSDGGNTWIDRSAGATHVADLLALPDGAVLVSGTGPSGGEILCSLDSGRAWARGCRRPPDST
jgi:photosystem II stability/assembly factor-like uncharacterized protein